MPNRRCPSGVASHASTAEWVGIVTGARSSRLRDDVDLRFDRGRSRSPSLAWRLNPALELCWIGGVRYVQA